MRRVLFVCTGNQCRSAAAVPILQSLAREVGLEVEITSAGTHAWHDIPAQATTIEAASLEGYDLHAHRSRPVTKALLDQADVVLAMARDHVAWLGACYPEDQHRVFLFKPYCEGRDSATAADDIPDPVGAPLPVHVTCVRQIEGALRQLVARWKREDA